MIAKKLNRRFRLILLRKGILKIHCSYTEKDLKQSFDELLQNEINKNTDAIGDAPIAK